MKSLVKWLLRQLLYARLRWFPLSDETALYWVEVMKRWPAIFAADPYRRQIRLQGGGVMTVGLIDVVERNLLLHGEWDTHVLRVLEGELRPGHTFVDVGANIGYFSLVASALVGAEGRVLALEPAHVNLSRLGQHVWDNAAANILVASLAAGREYATVGLNFPTFNNAGAATLRPCSSMKSSLVLQVPLDDLIEAHGIRPDLLKLDVEGYELEALRGLQRTLQKFTPVVICELTDRFLREIGQDARQLLEFMEQFGYRCNILAGGNVEPGRALASSDAALPDGQLDVVFRR
jgi:FkbM family methyltransferase